MTVRFFYILVVLCIFLFILDCGFPAERISDPNKIIKAAGVYMSGVLVGMAVQAIVKK